MKNGQSKFKLLNHFSIASAISFFITLIFLGSFYRRQSLKELVASGERTNVALAQVIANSIWTQYAPYLKSSPSIGAEQLRDRPQTALLDKAITKEVRGLSVVKVQIYDLTGKTIFSTDRTQIGLDKSNSPGFKTARSGQVLTQLDHRDVFQAISGQNLSDRQILSSYVPIYSGDDKSKIKGVFELYSDVTPLIEQISQNKRNVVSGTTLIFLLLYLVLFLIIRRANNIIDAQTLELERSQIQYKQQAQLEAKIAKQAEATAIIIDRVRRSQNIDAVFKDTTKELRRALESDRVVIYQLDSDTNGLVAAESVSSGWNSMLVDRNNYEVMQSNSISSGCLLQNWLQEIQNTSSKNSLTQATARSIWGQNFSAVDDIYTQNFPDSYLKCLEKYQAKAYLIVPIFQQERLWGLLGAYQNDGTRVWRESEIDLTLLTANQLAVALQQAEYVNQLKLQKKDLELAIKESKLAQNRLIQQEKLAALGQLIAGIAHEINTPLGAIQASANDNTQALVYAISELPKLLEYLSESESEVFFSLLDIAVMSKPFYLSSEKRPLKRRIKERLQEYNIDNARRLADLLTDIGVYDEVDSYLLLLKHPQVDWILDLAYNVACLMGSNQTIISSVEKATKVVFALKNYARFDRSGEKQPAKVTAGLETVLEIYHSQLKHNIDVIRDYQEFPPIWCYPDELIQVWTNLIHNAIHAMKEGGVLTIVTSEEDRGIKVEISDTGSGIPQDIQNQIFDPFFTTKPIGEGSGLGLHICQQIIDKHQGKISVESQTGRTKFTVWLPINY